MKILPTSRILAVVWLAGASGAFAREQPQQLADLADLSLEQLTRITVTSASRREERLVEAPTSIFVLTADDIRRSGATSLPEVLRLAPNLHVARADNNQYAISARGYNNPLANKMLVLIDGRTVYTPLFSGVFWEAQDFLLDDVDRIEVISGPGATLWGANAVNGVINITTLASRKTQGTLFKGGIGDFERGAVVRHGAALGADGHVRIYAKYFRRDHQELADGTAIRDESRRATAGFRADILRPQQEVTVQGDAFWGEIDQLPEARTFSGASLLGRWRRALGNDSSLRVQAYYDHTRREHPRSFEESLDIFDLDVQHSLRPRPAHMLVWGGGYRYARDRVENSASQAFIPPDRNLDWANVFAQDEITLAPHLNFTLGLKAERNPYTGTEWLPNARLAWQLAENHFAWGALSRAVRAPSRIDREVNFPGVPPFLLVASDVFESEVANVAEVGYRAQLSATSSLSLTAFHHDYPNLRSVRLTPSGPVFANDIEGRTNGIEGWGSFRLAPNWRISGGFVFQDLKREVKAGRADLGGLPSLGNDPERTALVRSSWDIGPRHELDLALRHVGELPNPAVPAYTVLDARIGWRPVRNLELSLAVQNVFDREHAEWGVDGNRASFGRNFFLKAVWRP